MSRLISRKKQNKSFFTNNLIAYKSPIWVGGFVVLFLAVLFTGTPKAHAADDWGNKDLALAIKNVGPIVSTEIAEKDKQSQTDSADAYIEKPIVAETQITKEVVVYRTRTVTQTAPAGSKQVLAARSTRAAADYSLVKGPHYFPYGYCTYYVSQKRVVTWSGNAGTWLSGAKAAGLATGNTPKVGAIMVTSEGGSVGHVAYIEAINDNQMTVSEMNYKGFGIVSTRTVPIGSKFIKGFIY